MQKVHNQVKILKHADFASEWRKSRFRGLEISKFSEGGCPRTTLLGRRLRRPPFLEPPLLKAWIRARVVLEMIFNAVTTQRVLHVCKMHCSSLWNFMLVLI